MIVSTQLFTGAIKNWKWFGELHVGTHTMSQQQHAKTVCTANGKNVDYGDTHKTENDSLAK